MKSKNISVFFIAIIIAGFFFWLMLKAERKSFIYPNMNVAIPENFTYFGIDISHHQGIINFEEVKHLVSEGDTIAFIYIKATEGKDFLDSQLAVNIEGAEEYSLPYGCYHYYRPETPAKQQAIHFAKSIEFFDTDLLPVLDIEEIGELSPEGLLDSLSIFIKAFAETTGDTPIIYSFESFYADYLRKDFGDYNFWIAAYKKSCKYIDDDNVIMWQFTDKGNVDGIGEFTDLNVAKGKFDTEVRR